MHRSQLGSNEINLKGENKVSLSNTISGEIWIMDSGCSRHITGNLNLLSNVNNIQGGYVAFAGNQGACYTLNHVLTVKKLQKTSYEILNNRKPNLKSLEPFECPCTMLKQDAGKFDEKAIESYYLGYAMPKKCVFNFSSGCVEECYCSSEDGHFKNSSFAPIIENPEVNEVPTGESSLTVDDITAKENLTNLSDHVVMPENLTLWINKYHPEDNIIGYLDVGVRTRHQVSNANNNNVFCAYTDMHSSGS
ncbi:uncharacterized protein LOC143540268 [Bidens hawaiensis]|uniref:uncharacterized protein LOC143540268 n=1 Tax=Bidens hawaiensis TaxID=980011 RepID=UPI00404A0FA7